MRYPTFLFAFLFLTTTATAQDCIRGEDKFLERKTISCKAVEVPIQEQFAKYAHTVQAWVWRTNETNKHIFLKARVNSESFNFTRERRAYALADTTRYRWEAEQFESHVHGGSVTEYIVIGIPTDDARHVVRAESLRVKVGGGVVDMTPILPQLHKVMLMNLASR